jgi:hypothetical protein
MYLLIAGGIIIVVSWIAAWSSAGVFTEYSFFPLWVGYILTINGVSEVCGGISLLRATRWHFLSLYAASIPLWWFFELVNRMVNNWEYILPHPISDLHYFVQASVSFGTVVPAVLSTAFPLYHLLRRHFRGSGAEWAVRKIHLWIAVMLGVVSFSGLWLFPQETFPLVWIAPILLLEPVAYITGSPSILHVFSRGRYLLPMSVMTGTLFTGFWWELWNFYSMPKWIYHIPYVGFWNVFEMPVLGYLGYPLFGLIVFSWASLVFSLLFRIDLVRVFEQSKSEAH